VEMFQRRVTAGEHEAHHPPEKDEQRSGSPSPDLLAAAPETHFEPLIHRVPSTYLFFIALDLPCPLASRIPTTTDTFCRHFFHPWVVGPPAGTLFFFDIGTYSSAGLHSGSRGVHSTSIDGWSSADFPSDTLVRCPRPAGWRINVPWVEFHALSCCKCQGLRETEGRTETRIAYCQRWMKCVAWLFLPGGVVQNESLSSVMRRRFVRFKVAALGRC